MKLKLWPLLFLTACFQQGLVSTPGSENSISSPPSSLTTGGDSITETVAIKTEKKQSINTVFADKKYPNSTAIQGYGSGTKGETFCFSNERVTGSGFDSAVTCRKPLYSSTALSGDEEDVLTTLEETTGRTSASGLPMVIQALQLYFSNSTTIPDDKNYSLINNDSLQISVRTAPLLFNPDSGYFYWDRTNETEITYAGSPNTCNISNPNTVGFKITSDSSLSGLSSAEKSKYFLTGLWFFERGEMRPYETRTINPIGPYGSGSTVTGSGPSQLFATRANAFASLLLPLDDIENLGFQFFPGRNSTDGDFTPSSQPNPFKFSFGLYRQNIVATADGNYMSTDNEDNLANLSTNLDGAVKTPVMGKYNNGIEVPNWKQSVITGLCIRGTRAIYTGEDTPDDTYPLIHALKYELRKIKVYLQ
ncbi:MAG: hypothetical protein R3A80_12545 [Bdellovibrionota bacterium]